MKVSPPPAKRPYKMSARAEKVIATEEVVANVALQLFTERPYDDVSLEDVAAAAGVTKPTILRRFGSKEGLFVSSMQRAAHVMMRERGAAPVGNVEGAVANILDHYERWGRNRLRLLSQEDRLEVVRDNVEDGRRYHYSWVETTFAPLLERHRGAKRKRVIAALIVLTDVYTWKLLRLDLEHSREQTHRILVDLIQRLKGEH